MIALRFAAGTGEGNVTSLSYAYLLAATFVTATAFSLSLIAAAPLTRRGVDAESAAEHVVHSAWVSLALVGAAAGLVALVGGRVVTAVLGEAYSGQVGDELGLSEGAVKVAVHRLRQRYRELLREEIGRTVGTPEEIEEEIRELFAALGP